MTSSIPAVTLTVTNVLVSGNCINSTLATADNSTLITYNYFQGIVNDAYCTITNNMISGVALTTTSNLGTLTNPSKTALILLNGFTSQVNNNILSRGTQNITAFVYNGNGKIHSVVNNYFDSPTIDGTNISLDAGTLAGSNYSRNINQTASISISLMDYARYIAGGSGTYSAPAYGNADTTGPAFPTFANIIDKTVPNVVTESIFAVSRITNGSSGSEYTWIQANTMEINAPNGMGFAATVPLDAVLPPDVKIVQVLLGVGLNEVGVATLNQIGQQTNQISLNLIQYGQTANISDVLSNVEIVLGIPIDTSVANVDSFTLIVYDPTAGDSGPTYNIVKESTIMHSTQYCTITPTYGSLMTGPAAGYKMSVEVDMVFNVSGNNLALPQYVSWFLSPIVVQYRW